MSDVAPRTKSYWLKYDWVFEIIKFVSIKHLPSPIVQMSKLIRWVRVGRYSRLTNRWGIGKSYEVRDTLVPHVFGSSSCGSNNEFGMMF